MVRAANNANRRKTVAVKALKGGADARLKIIAKNRGKVKDARDRLVSLNHASGVDARAKLTKIRNLKQGKLDVQTTKGGAITITKTTQGKTILTTKKKSGSPKKGSGGGASGQKDNGRNVTKTVGRGGTISLKTKNKIQATLTGVARTKNTPAVKAAPTKAAPAKAARKPAGKPAVTKRKSAPATTSSRNLTRTIRGEMSEAARLDHELMNTRVDPVILKRTVNQNIRERENRMSPPLRTGSYKPSRRSPSPYYSSNRMRSRSRSRSPLDVDAYDSRRSRGTMHYRCDDPRREMEREESYSRRLQQQHTSPEAVAPLSHRTMADRYDTHASPLEGAKVVVTNLQTSVTKDDIVELFGDVGALKRAKVSSPGTAEVVFVNRTDAQKAVEIYHNRQLDGKAMRCNIVGAAGMESVSTTGNNSSYRLPAGASASNGRGDRGRRGSPGLPPPVELNSIHRALFDERKGGRGRHEEANGGGGDSYRRRSGGDNRSRRY